MINASSMDSNYSVTVRKKARLETLLSLCRVRLDEPTSLCTIATESKIAAKLEISLGIGEGDGDSSSFDRCQSITHLGYITLDSNERTEFLQREMKSVPVERPADFVQLVLVGCHQNVHNIHNQVSLVGVRVLGVANNVVEEKTTSQPPPANESPIAPMKKVEVPSVIRPETERSLLEDFGKCALRPVSSLPPNMKNELDTKMQSACDSLERLKKERASQEDFDMAGKIKEALGNVYALLISYKDCEAAMRKAAAEEDYSLASRLKAERDHKKKAATETLSEVAGRFGHLSGPQNPSPRIGFSPASSKKRDAVGDLSISTIKDDSFVTQRSKVLSPKKSSFLETSSISSRPRHHGASDDESQGSSIDSQDGAHPLGGVDNAEELPMPEEINEHGAASSDLIHKVEGIFGSYRTKSLFSKNWMLREAALAKVTLMLSEETAITNDSAEVICNIIEVGIDDKNVQVYLAACLLLDELLIQLESIGMPQSKASPLFSRIVLNLLGKLADSKQKVFESAELALLSVASSSSIDKASIVNAASKRIRSKDSKGGRAVKARLVFLENLVTEFGDGIGWKRVVEFAKGQKAFEHKDGGVRDAAKSLIVTLMTVHSDEAVLESLSDSDQVSERQLNEFRSRFALICTAGGKP
ncbi:hypothetical protein ACHAWF_010746 [Thalassiosira exigua]